MRIPPQVSERVKEAPAQALRAVFSGIGQVLLVADRIKNRAAEPSRDQPGTTGRRGQPGQGGSARPKDESRWRSLDETGNVRLLSHDDAAWPAQGTTPGPPAAPEPAAAGPQPATAPAAFGLADPEPATFETMASETAESEPETANEPASEADTGRGQAALPVPAYDDLSVASLRARLRNLDSDQVRVLLEYEKAHAGRAAVLTMFERRIAKLEDYKA